MSNTKSSDTVLALTNVDLLRNDRKILHNITWSVRKGERWAVLGPNGSGKTTLCRLVCLYLHPSCGTIDVLGQRLGKVDVRELRTRIGFTSTSLLNMLRPDLRVSDVVVTGKHAALTPFWHNYTDDDTKKALALLKRVGCAQQQNSRLGILSTGEQQRVLLARTLMSDPSMLILDEPAAGLDLGGREKLVSLLNSLALDQNAPSTVLVTHHVDEIPPDFTHVLLLANGRVSTMGPIEQTLTSEALSNCFKIGLNLERRNGRWLAWSTEKLTWII